VLKVDKEVQLKQPFKKNTSASVKRKSKATPVTGLGGLVVL
jgi:hypothetical protein